MRPLFLLFVCAVISGCATAGQDKISKACGSAEADVTVVDISWLDKVIGTFSEELKARPEQPGIYYNRALAYYYKKDYDKSWEDVRMVQKLSGKVDPSFIKRLEDASGVKE